MTDDVTLCTWPIEPKDKPVHPCGKRAVAVVWVGRKPYPKCRLHFGPRVQDYVAENPGTWIEFLR